jgi:hypothetical protein
MSQRNKSLCSKIMSKILCFNCWKSEPKTVPKIPKDIAEVLSDVNVSTEYSKKEFVNKIENEYQTQYGTRVNTIVVEEEPKKKTKIKLSIDNDYIRKSSDNLEDLTSPRERPEL